ncbi:MAG: DNA repair protein RecO [Ruminococcaceae bacterium]|nr:DNA repair protein RecO [Oscillospiraceae bacterium]
MEEFTLPALVIRECDIGEQDKLLTLLSAQRGKLTVKVHGCRNIKSKNMACSSLFCYGNFTVTEKNGRMTVKESSLQENFFDLRMDVCKLALGNYVAEVLLSVSTEENEETELMLLGLNTLYAICHHDKDLRLLKAAFELRVLALLGFMPDLSSCSDCSEEPAAPLFFDLQEGNLLCGSCRQLNLRQTPLVSIGNDTLSAMRYVLTAPAKRIFSFLLSEQSLEELSLLAERFLITQTETNFKSLKFYHSVTQGTI